MKIIDREGRLFGVISVIDVVVILVVAALAGAVFVKTHRPQTGSGYTTTPVVYQMKVENQPAYMLDNIQVGDKLFDKERSTGGSLGEILDIQVSDGSKKAELDNGTVAIVPAEERYDLILTIRGEALIEENGSVMLNRIYNLGVNSHRSFNTKYAWFEGKVLDIQVQDQ